jgi:hypothetical protein
MPLAGLELQQLENAFQIDGVAVTAEIGGCNLRLKLAGNAHDISTGAQMKAAGITYSDHDTFGQLMRRLQL